MLDSLKSLLQEQVQDLYSAENQLVKAIPKMVKAAANKDLRAAFSGHLEQTREHVERLQQIAELLGTKPGGKKCKATEGLVAEAAEVLEEEGEESVIDSALISAAVRVEHYEIAAYGAAIAMAEQLGERQVTKLLQKTLDEEFAAEERLSSLLTEEMLPAAAEGAEKPAMEVQTKVRGRSSAKG